MLNYEGTQNRKILRALHFIIHDSPFASSVRKLSAVSFQLSASSGDLSGG
jgi:hypothetical protein